MEPKPEMCRMGCGVCDTWVCVCEEDMNRCKNKETAIQNNKIHQEFLKEYTKKHMEFVNQYFSKKV